GDVPDRRTVSPAPCRRAGRARCIGRRHRADTPRRIQLGRDTHDGRYADFQRSTVHPRYFRCADHGRGRADRRRADGRWVGGADLGRHTAEYRAARLWRTAVIRRIWPLALGCIFLAALLASRWLTFDLLYIDEWWSIFKSGG